VRTELRRYTEDEIGEEGGGDAGGSSHGWRSFWGRRTGQVSERD
jgi:hypothetical protein